MQTSGYNTGLSLLSCMHGFWEKFSKSVFISRDNITTHRVFWNSAGGFGLSYICWEGAWCLVSCKEFHKENYSLSCTMFAHLARHSSGEKKPFVLSESKTILCKHKVVGFFAKFSYTYCILQECNCPAHWETYVRCFVPNLIKSYSPLPKDSTACAFEASEQHTCIRLHFSSHIHGDSTERGVDRECLLPYQ